MTCWLQKLSTANLKFLLAWKQFIFKQNWLQITKGFLTFKYFNTYYWAYKKITVNYFFKPCKLLWTQPKSECIRSSRLNYISNTTFVAQKCIFKRKITLYDVWGDFFKFLKRERFSKWVWDTLNYRLATLPDKPGISQVRIK